jgi:ribonuclease G
MSKELIVSVNGREKKIAIVEDDVVTEFYVERGDENQGIVGNIYKGRVMKVLPGMQSAFVDIGLERDSFLYVSDFFDDEEFEEVAVPEKKEAARQITRPERPRPAREAARADSILMPEPPEVEEKDVDLHVAALRHIKEISEEPAVVPSPDEERLGSGVDKETTGDEVEPKKRPADYSPRQRRQRRLRYAEQEESEAASEIEKEQALRIIEEEVSAPDAETYPVEAEAEEEYTGRRRRRRNRRSAEPSEIDVSDRHEVVESFEDSFAPSGYTPIVIVHHEPLERITDDDEEAIEGEMLKDALVQERISERIHQEERRTSLLEVEPTPEVLVGSLHHAISRETGLERISDDSSETEIEPEKDTILYGWERRDVALPDARVPDATLESTEVIHADDGLIENFVESGDEMEPPNPARRTDQSGAGNATEENTEEEGLKDASAEIRQRPPRGEFAATRRGGRGRRRGFRQRPAAAGVATEPEEALTENGGEQEPAVSPVPAPRQAERFTRPVISDLLREGQEIIVQIAKEPIGQKGARITSHIALPGRYIVYLPTVEHIGVSRKIGTDEERQRLKRTLHQLRAESNLGGGFIVRTAASGCTLEELREDIQYLVRTWTDIRRRSERSKAPTIVHRDLDLIQRILRDQLSSDFTAIRVDNEFEYERIVDFVNRFAPKLVNRVKLYTKDTPILEQYGVQMEIDKAVKPRVWLKSGGYIVINQTEALVAIDVNTGKFVGKSNRLEDTIVKTNLEAAKEIVRQIRLRDLGGIIVLDFIDMEERRNRQKIMQALEQELRNDRSPSKILQFNDFGLVAITRKRVKQSLERTLCTPCYYCGGGGMIKSAQTICYEILAEARRVSKDVDRHNEVILRVNPEVAKTLRGTERDILNEIESYLGGLVTIKSDPTVHQEQFDIALA